jgi:hypothetical protein
MAKDERGTFFHATSYIIIIIPSPPLHISHHPFISAFTRPCLLSAAVILCVGDFNQARCAGFE